MEVEKRSDDTLSNNCTRKAIGYRKKEWINKGILEWIRNKIFESVWIKDLPMLYYSILDDESI